MSENVIYKPMQAYTTPATGTNNVPSVCQVERGGGGIGEKRNNNIRTKKDRQTDGRQGGNKDLETQ